MDRRDLPPTCSRGNLIVDSFAKQDAEERRVYFEQASAHDGRLSAQLIEKDFWVCWILRRLFQLHEIKDHLTFKGGTSLSKVYGVIHRFSEDVDLSIERGYLGFGGENDPEKGSSGKETQRRLARLKEKCRAFVVESLSPDLENAVSVILGENSNWELALDADDPDSQSIRFHYPPAISTKLSPYFAQSVKIELGARSDHFPIEAATIRPYLAEILPVSMDDRVVQLRVLDAARTFWEKATILHSICHQPSEKRVVTRMSRHYYDLFQLANDETGQRALERLDLLERVATHKTVFFKAAWARYDEAKPGSLRLVPGQERIKELEEDFIQMQPMFFDQAPEFGAILASMRHLENQINSP
jgi:hypothetical protein